MDYYIIKIKDVQVSHQKIGSRIWASSSGPRHTALHGGDGYAENRWSDSDGGYQVMEREGRGRRGEARDVDYMRKVSEHHHTRGRGNSSNDSLGTLCRESCEGMGISILNIS